MAPTEMIQIDHPQPYPHPTTPPSSPNPSSSEHAVTLSNAQQLIDMVKAIVTMEIASTAPASKLPCSYTLSESPTLHHTSPQPVTMEHLEQLLLKLIESKAPDSARVFEAPRPAPEGDKPMEELDNSMKIFKTVHEVWDEKAYKYVIVESLNPVGEVTELDQHIFVVRGRVDKKTKDTIFYVDINSEPLREILRDILKGVRGISLKEDRLSLGLKLLYCYLPDLQLGQGWNDIAPLDHPGIEHLRLLVEYIFTTYNNTTLRLNNLLRNNEITYDLLWALFKPNTVACTTCAGTKKPRCIRYDSGEEKTSANGTEYFHIEGRYIDSDGKVLGEVSIAAGILKFPGSKPIIALEIFPLQFHPNKEQMDADLLRYGRDFISLTGSRHLQYEGMAFQMKNGEPVAISVSSKIIVDAALFLKINPNYSRPSINPAVKKGSSGLAVIDVWDLFNDSSSSPPDDRKVCATDLKDLNTEDLLVCSPTVLGYSLNDKLWLEFAVADISDISWNNTLFDHLRLPDEKKTLVKAMALSNTTPGRTFDDFVVGKGQGLIMLFYGPPGVGKTLTAEALSEELQRPLYVVSAGNLSRDAKELELGLSHVFELAHHWKALVLIDEADVYLSQRLLGQGKNSLVSVFLRQLEYYRGIMFLTTNRVTDFDEAIMSRIHLALRYDALGLDTKEKLWEDFLQKAHATYSRYELSKLAEHKLNGRQIKNTVRAAQALAVYHRVDISYVQVKAVMDAGANLESDYEGAGKIANQQSYF